MSQERPSIENERARISNVAKMIEVFAEQKARRKS